MVYTHFTKLMMPKTSLAVNGLRLDGVELRLLRMRTSIMRHFCKVDNNNYCICVIVRGRFKFHCETE